MRVPLRLQPLLVGLTLLNLGILGVVVLRERAVAADGVLRGRSLQIVDGQGRVRASITVDPATRQPDGSTYPETVLLRLVTAGGRPVVKIASSEDGAGMALSAAEGPAYVQVLARGGDPKLVIVDGAGKPAAKLP